LWTRQDNGESRAGFSAADQLYGSPAARPSGPQATSRASRTTTPAPDGRRRDPAGQRVLDPELDAELFEEVDADERPDQPGDEVADKPAATDDPARQPSGREADPELGGEGTLVRRRERLAVDLDPDGRLPAAGGRVRDPVVL
jgi:hypothetical protein